MAEPDYRIRPGTATDVPAILSLMRASLGEGSIPRTSEYWNWKHEENPFGPSYFWVAEAAEGLIGVRVFMRWTWQLGAQTVRAVRAVDTATHPDWQGRGIFRNLTLGLAEDVAKQGVSFVFNTPNDKSRPGYLKMGWRRVGRLSLWVRPHNPLRIAGGLTRANRASSIDSTVGLGPPLPGTELLESAEVDELLRNVQRPLERYHTGVESSYLRWRYAGCPAARYGVASSSPRRALVVYRVRRRRGLRELTLCDVLAERSSAGLRSAVGTIRALMRSVSPDYAVAAAHRDPFEASVMVASGFVPAPGIGPVVVVRPLGTSASLPDPLSLSNFHQSIGDMELF